MAHDLSPVLGSVTSAWIGTELVATGRLGPLTPADEDVIIRDEVPVRVPRADLTLVSRRTIGWWKGLLVDVQAAHDGTLTVWGSIAKGDPPLPAEADEERGRFSARLVDGSELFAVRSFTDQLRFDESPESESLGPFAGDVALRGFDVVPASADAPCDGVLVGLDGSTVSSDRALTWRRQLGERHESDAERLRLDGSAVLTALSPYSRPDGTVPSSGEFWIGNQVRVGWLDRSGFSRTADVTRSWDRPSGSAAIMAGTYVQTERGWFPGAIRDEGALLHSWAPTSPGRAWEPRPSSLMTNQSRSEARITRDAVVGHATVRTTATVSGVSVQVEHHWNAAAWATVEVRALDGRRRTIHAADGAAIRFVEREGSVTAFVRPEDLDDLESEQVA